MTRPIMKELALEPYSDTSILNSVAANLDNLDMAKVFAGLAQTTFERHPPCFSLHWLAVQMHLVVHLNGTTL